METSRWQTLQNNFIACNLCRKSLEYNIFALLGVTTHRELFKKYDFKAFLIAVSFNKYTVMLSADYRNVCVL